MTTEECEWCYVKTSNKPTAIPSPYKGKAEGMLQGYRDRVLCNDCIEALKSITPGDTSFDLIPINEV